MGENRTKLKILFANKVERQQMFKLPTYAALKSKYNNRYLRYVDKTCSPVHTFLRYSSDEILSPFTKFEFEQATSDPSLYHIKCCYNNKYWSTLSSGHHFIVAGAEEKQEDRSKWNCTLFRPIFDTCNQSYRFLHVRLGFNVVLWRVGPPYNEVLGAQWLDQDRDHCDLSIVINWDSLTMLPKYVAFKGDNGSYLSAHMINNHFLKFSSNNIEDDTIWMETLATKDGNVRIKSIHYDRLWKRGASNWILADTCPNTLECSDTLFSPTKLAPNVVSLRNLGNGNFVKRYTSGGKTNLFDALNKELDVHSRLEIIELVHLREIHNVEFHSVVTKISGGVNVALTNKEVTNNTNFTETVKLRFSYKNEVSSRWSSSVSTKLGVKTRLKSMIAVIGDEKKFEILPTKFSGEYKWGETITTSNAHEKIFEVTIPPMHSVFITLNATNTLFQVPFSYKQTDILIGGKTVEYSLDDGVYHGANYYNFSIQITNKSLCEYY